MSSFTVSPNPPPPPSQLSSSPVPETDDVLSWLREKVNEGEAFLQAQPGYSKISKAIDVVNSEDEGPARPESSLSQTSTNRAAKIAEDIAALLTDTKPFWDYSVYNRRFEQHAQIYGKLATRWYQQRNVDLRMADVIKYYTVAGTGYLHIFWNPDLGDVDCCAEDPRNVIPISPLAYDSLESCLGVVIKRKVPVSYIKDRHNLDVKAEADGSWLSWLRNVRDSAADIISPIWRWQKSQKSEPDLPRIPTVTLYTCYLRDDRVNKKKVPVEMGEFIEDPSTLERKPKYNWCYVVQPGEPLFPNRRMISWVGDHKLYDGPSFYWHARFPLIKVTLNPWPWNWFGKAPLHDLLKLQRSLNKLLRVIDDHNDQVAQPGAVMDKNSVSRAEFNSFDSRKPGYKIYQNPLAGKGIQIQTPVPLDPSVPNHIKWIIEEMETLAGKLDLTKMMNLNQLPSNSTVESIINSMTPALRFRSRILESVAREIAMQVAYHFTQFYTLPMRVAVVGPGGIVQDDFDYDPGTLMPDFVHDTDYDSAGSIKPEALLRGPMPRWNRSREFLRRFTFKVSPGSLLNAAQVEQKLIYLQLTRAGWMDIFTLWEILGIPNIGVLPDNVRTIPERLQYQMELGLTGDVNAAGRKASGQEPPRIKVSESG